MGGFNQISGPVIAFQIDETSLIASTQAALAKINAQIQQSNKVNATQLKSQIANPLQEMAAKLRAAFSTGTIGLQAMQVEQKKLVGLLDNGISLLQKRDSLTKSELATLKQLTLERERQQNALNRNVGLGVTSGTSSALSLVTNGVNAAITRNVSQLGARLVGIAGGSGLEASAFTAAASGIAQITAAGGPAIGVLGSVAIAAAAAATAAGALAVQGGNVAERLSNISQRTGISIRDLQVLETVAKTSELSLEDLVGGFRKFSQALTGGAGGEAGGFEGAGKKSAEVLKLLGVTSKDSFAALEQTAEAFQKLPDGPLKAAAAIELFGRSGLNLIPILNQGKAGIEANRAIVEKFSGAITKDGLDSQQKYQLATVSLSESFDKLKISAIPVLDVITKITTATAEFVSKASDFNVGSLINPTIPFFGKLPGAGANSGGAKFFGIDFDAVNAGIDKTGPKLKALADLLSGKTEAIAKSIEEGRKELAALNEEAAKSALGQLTGINTSSQLGGLTPQDKVLEEQRQKLEAIAEIMLNFPQFANQAQAAVTNLTRSTVDQLEKITNDALKQVQDENDRLNAAEAKRVQDLANLIRGVDDDLAVARMEASGNASAKIIADEQRRYDDAVQKATALGATEQQLQDLRVKFNEEAQAKIVNLQREQLKKTQDDIKNEAGRLFDSLVSGSKNFAQALKQSLLTFALTPVKLVFEAVASAIFTPIVEATKKQLTALGDALKGKGGILGEIGKALSPDDKVIKNTQITDLNTKSTDRNTDALNNLTGALGGGNPANTSSAPTSGGGLGNFGSVFGGATGAGSVIFNGLPGSGGGAGGGLAGFGGLGTIGLGLALAGIKGNGTAGAVGAGLAGGGLAISRIGAVLAKTSPGLGIALGTAGGIIGGAGSFISGIKQGGLAGTLQTTLGGAEIGTAILPGIGTAVGAAVGFVAGAIRSLFGRGPTRDQLIANAISRQTVSPSLFSGNAFIGQEFDRAAQDTFSATAGSTFSEGPNGSFSSTRIGGGPTIYYAPTIQAFDSSGVDAVLANHGTRIAQAVSARVLSTNSGVGRAARQAVSPA